MIEKCTINTPLGQVTASAQNEALTGLWFAGQKHYPLQADEWTVNHNNPVFKLLRKWLFDYFSGKNPKLNIKINPLGTDFQKAVWDILLEIPYGKVITYSETAKRINCASARATGGAVGRNPISVLIPCHRVIGSNGNITGYAGGIEKKRALLEIEQNLSGGGNDYKLFD